MLHDYQKAGDKTKESLDKRLAFPPSTKIIMHIKLLHYKNILRGFFGDVLPNVYVYLFTFTCVNFVSGF